MIPDVLEDVVEDVSVVTVVVVVVMVVVVMVVDVVVVVVLVVVVYVVVVVVVVIVVVVVVVVVVPVVVVVVMVVVVVLLLHRGLKLPAPAETAPGLSNTQLELDLDSRLALVTPWSRSHNVLLPLLSQLLSYMPQQRVPAAIQASLACVQVLYDAAARAHQLLHVRPETLPDRAP